MFQHCDNMAYVLSWGSKHPGHLVYLLDLSQSMAKNRKIDYLLEAVKNSCDHLTMKCFGGTDLKNRFSVSVLGYNTDVFTVFKGSVRELDAKLEEIYVQGGENTPLFDKTSEAMPRGQKCTAKAFRAVKEDIMEWINSQRRKNIPMPAPVVIHITDGRPTEEEREQTVALEDALRAAEEIKQINLPDGNPILINIHYNNETPEILFPIQNPNDEDLQFLFDASSVMDDELVERVRENYLLPTQQGCRCMVSNVKDLNSLSLIVSCFSFPPVPLPKIHDF